MEHPHISQAIAEKENNVANKENNSLLLIVKKFMFDN
jgi:hypothetical protein